MLVLIELLLFILLMYELNRYTDTSKRGIRLLIVGVVNTLLLFEIHFTYGITIGVFIMVVTLFVLLMWKKI